MITINHKDDALACLITADQHLGTEMSNEIGEYKSDIIALAQVHATLALVDQQRIANLLTIALGQHADTGMSRVASDMAYISLVENGEDGNLRPDIARALGLEQEDAS